MSARYVRTTFRSFLTGATLPVYDTINLAQSPTDDTWMTYEFVAEYSEKDSFCDNWTELGVINLVFIGQPGDGDDTVLAAAEAEASRLYKSNDSTGRLTFTNLMPPEEYSGGDGDAEYRIIIGLEYRYSDLRI